MTVALVLDFPGGTQEQYNEVLKRLDLDGRMPDGGMVHVAGSYEGGWRVIDVWEDIGQFERFRDERMGPAASAAGLAPPNVRVIEVDEQKPGSGGRSELVQCVMLPGLDRQGFHAADDEILEGGPPGEITFHVNGPLNGGWCVIDGWTSKQVRDGFIESRVKPAMEKASLQGPPQIEDLMVEATLTGAAGART